MPFETKMTSEQAIEKLNNLYGTEITTADIKAFCAMNDITYQTVTKKLSNFKVSKGKWNLEVTSAVVENIEKSYQSQGLNSFLMQVILQEICMTSQCSLQPQM